MIRKKDGNVMKNEQKQLLALIGCALIIISMWFTFASGYGKLLSLWDLYEDAPTILNMCIWGGIVCTSIAIVLIVIKKDIIALLFAAIAAFLPMGYLFYNFEEELLKPIIELEAVKFGLGFYFTIAGYVMVIISCFLKRRESIIWFLYMRKR